MSRPLRRLLPALGLTAALALVAGIGPLAAPSRANAPSTEEVAVEVLDIAPAVAGPGTGLEVSGTVRNVSDSEFEDLVVLVRAAPRSLSTRDGVESWENGSDTASAGLVRATAHLDGSLLPGDERDFTAVIEDGAITPEFALGTLPVTVHVLPGSDFDGPTGEFSDENEPVPPWDPTENILPRGEERALLPWADTEADAAIEPLETAWLVPLTLPADLDLFSLDAAARDAAWLEALGPDSAVTAWLDGAGGVPVTYAVEPGLLDPVTNLVSLTEPVPETDPVDPVEPEEPEEPEEPVDPSPSTPGAPATPSAPGSTSAPLDPSPSTTGPGTAAVGDGAAAAGSAQTSTPPVEPTEPVEPSDPTGTPSPEDGAPPVDEQMVLAEEVLGALLEQRSAGSGLWSLPTADLDLAALQDAGATPEQIGSMLDPVQPLALDALADPLNRPALPGDARRDIAWPLTSSYGDSLVSGSAAAWAESPLGDLAGIVLPASTLSPAGGSTPDGLARHPSGVPVLAYDDALSDLLTDAMVPADRFRARQRLLAETLAAHQEGGVADRALVLASPRGLVPDPATRVALEATLADAPWLRFVPADDLLADSADLEDAPELTVTGPGPTLAPGAGGATDVPGPAFTDSLVERYDDARTGLRTATTVLTDIDQRRADWDRFLVEGFSSRWRQAPDVPETMIGRVEETIEAVGSGIRIVPSSVNFIADQGVIQVTIVNELDVTVHDIGLTARPTNGRLLVRDEEAEAVTIGPGSRANVHLDAQARGAGEVTLQSRITAGDGQAIGEPEEILVRVQPLGVWWWWALGLIAAAVLVAGIVRAGRSRPRSDDDDTPGDTETEGEPA